MWQSITSTLISEFSDLPDAAQVTRIVLRLALAAALGGVLGYERERQGKAFSYRATTPRPEIERARMSRTIGGLFTGGARPAMAALVEALESIDAGLLDDLAQAVEAARLRPRGEP